MAGTEGQADNLTKDDAGYPFPYGKLVEVGNFTVPDSITDAEEIMVKVDGELLPRQRRVVVDSDMDETTIEVELVHLPTTGEILIKGYLIDEDDMELLRFARQVGFSREAFLSQPPKLISPHTPREGDLDGSK